MSSNNFLTKGLKLRLPALAPFLVGLAIVSSLYFQNQGQIQATHVARSAGLVLFLSLIIVISFRILFGDWIRAAIISSIIVFMLLTYGLIYSQIKAIEIGGLLIGRHRYLLLATILLIGSGLFLVRKISPTSQIGLLVVVVAAALLAQPILSSAWGLVSSYRGVQGLEAPNPIILSDPSEVAASGPGPDIYYIIVDAYARGDILNSYFEYDNQPFLSGLESRGFYIAENSKANYLTTVISLASSLNMDYIPNVPLDTSRGLSLQSFHEPIKNSAVRNQLEARGYVTVAVPTGSTATELYSADYFLIPDLSQAKQLEISGSLNRFETLLLHNTILKALLDLDQSRSTTASRFIQERLEYPFRVQREIILAAFDNVDRITQIPGQKFVFIHVISPHRPYMFGPNGEEVTYDEPFTFADPETTSEREIRLYRDQVIYINSRLEQAISTILEQSEEPPIILLQSDHGPGHGYDGSNPTRESLPLKTGILNAYYLPRECRDSLYPEITPVNSFKVIFNCIFATEYELREDITYYSDLEGPMPFEFVPDGEAVEPP